MTEERRPMESDRERALRLSALAYPNAPPPVVGDRGEVEPTGRCVETRQETTHPSAEPENGALVGSSRDEGRAASPRKSSPQGLGGVVRSIQGQNEPVAWVFEEIQDCGGALKTHVSFDAEEAAFHADAIALCICPPRAPDTERGEPVADDDAEWLREMANQLSREEYLEGGEKERLHRIASRLTGPPRGAEPTGEDWLPTAENVNALPEPVRRYIHDMETNADPAGTVRELTICRDTVAALSNVQDPEPGERIEGEPVVTFKVEATGALTVDGVSFGWPINSPLTPLAKHPGTYTVHPVSRERAK